MGREKRPARSRAAWSLAHRQHGVVARQQLLGLGFSEEAIEHRLAKGRLHSIFRGVYAVGWPGLTPERRWMAATLACGPTAALSHRSAAALWGIGKEGALIDVSVRGRTRRRRAGLHTRRRPTLPAEDIVRRAAIPVTSPARTLLDLATQLAPLPLERAINDADKLELIDPEELRAALPRYVGEPGVRSLRRLLDRYSFQLSDSELEILFRPIASRAGLPAPLTKAWVNGFEVDFLWPDLGLVVETDGLHYHRTAFTQTRDRLRDQAHTAAGLTPLRFTHWQVKHEPAHVRDVLERTVSRLQRAAGQISRAGTREK